MLWKSLIHLKAIGMNSSHAPDKDDELNEEQASKSNFAQTNQSFSELEILISEMHAFSYVCLPFISLVTRPSCDR